MSRFVPKFSCASDTWVFSRALAFGSGIFSLQAVGHDEALQAFIFDQRGDVFFFEKFPQAEAEHG